MEYYIFCGHRLAKRSKSFKCDWFVNGEWEENRQWTLALEDALHDYGDYSFGDQDQITMEIAEELIHNGTIVLQGNIGYGTTYFTPKTIELSDWKKPNSPE
jgi:hypothetical protein